MDKEKKNGNHRDGLKKTFLYILVVCLALIAFVLGLYVINFHGSFGSEQATWGTFGDYVGGVLNPIFAFASLIAILYSMHLQSEELENSSNELQRSAEALNSQIAISKQQTFDNTFFQLLSLHNAIIKDMDLKDSKNIAVSEGRDCFRTYYLKFKNHYIVAQDNITEAKGSYEAESMEHIEVAYDNFFKDNQSNVGHYFRNLYHIIKFIDNAEMVKETKKRYASIIRAQLSSYELALLFYNCLSRFGIDDFKPLVEKYSLLHNMGKDLLIDQVHEGYYARLAFNDEYEDISNADRLT